MSCSLAASACIACSRVACRASIAKLVPYGEQTGSRQTHACSSGIRISSETSSGVNIPPVTTTYVAYLVAGQYAWAGNDTVMIVSSPPVPTSLSSAARRSGLQPRPFHKQTAPGGVGKPEQGALEGSRFALPMRSALLV